jgi:hypothetical protein
VFKADLLPKGLGILLRIAYSTRKRRYSQNYAEGGVGHQCLPSAILLPKRMPMMRESSMLAKR